MQRPRFPLRLPRDPKPRRVLILTLVATAAAMFPKYPFGGGNGPFGGMGAVMIPMAFHMRDRTKKKTAALEPFSIPRPPAYLTRSAVA